jgi:hypothetical protein
MSTTVIQSYVFHGEKAFFVSTIERDSSCMRPTRYNETIVWDWDRVTRETGAMICQGDDIKNSRARHYQICELIAATGSPELQEIDA